MKGKVLIVISLLLSSCGKDPSPDYPVTNPLSKSCFENKLYLDTNPPKDKNDFFERLEADYEKCGSAKSYLSKILKTNPTFIVDLF